MAEQKMLESPYVKIPSSLGGILLVIVAIFALFAEESMNYITPIVWGLVVLGIVAIVFTYESEKKKKKSSK